MRALRAILCICIGLTGWTAARAARPSAEATLSSGCHAASLVESLTFDDEGTGTCRGHATPGAAVCLRTDNREPYLVATLASVGRDEWELTVRNVSDDERCRIVAVRFPYDAGLYHLSDGTTTPLPSREPLPKEDLDDVTITAQILGTAYRSSIRACAPSYACWADGPTYPGQLFSPMIVLTDNSRARILAATNWPPRRVATQWTAGRQSLYYPAENIGIRTARTYRALVATASGDAFNGNPPWMLVADRYTEWLAPHLAAEGITPFRYPEWAKRGQGVWNVGLQNTSDLYLGPIPGVSGGIPERWEKTRSFLEAFDEPGALVIPWIYFDGQMADYGEAGPAAQRCVVAANMAPFDCSSYPTTYASEHPCCEPFPSSAEADRITCRPDAIDIRLHPRYAGLGGTCGTPPKQGPCWDLPAFVRGLVDPPGRPDQARHVAFYTRPWGRLYDEEGNALPCDVAARTGGIDLQRAWQASARSWGANSYLVDTLGRDYYGDPLTIARHLRDGTFPAPPPRTSQTCGDGVRQEGEECDGANAGACTDGCTPYCTCRFFTGIEGANDLYTAASFVDEAVHQEGNVPGGPGRTLEDLRCNPCLSAIKFPQLGTYVLSDRILIDGDANNQFHHWGPCAVCDPPPPATGKIPCPYWVERQNFLLGHKFHSARLDSDALVCDRAHSPDPVHDPTCKTCAERGNERIRDLVSWRTRRDLAPGLPSWSARAPRYMDRKGIRAVPEGIDVRSFTSSATELLVFDNPSSLENRKVCFEGRWVAVPSTPFSIVAPSGAGESCAVETPPPLPACPPARPCSAR